MPYNSALPDYIPIVDIENRVSAARDFEKACHEVGFLYVIGHGITADLFVRVRAMVTAYFALSAEIKIRQRILRNNYRGYIPAGFFAPNSGAAPADNYEGFKLHFEVSGDDAICTDCDLYGPNRWPDQPEGFNSVILEYWSECDRVAGVLLTIIAGILAVEENRFLRMFKLPLTNMSLLHYPPQSPDANGHGIHPHKVVNASGKERYSFPYFVVPRFDTIVEPLCDVQPGFRRDAVHVGDVSREVWRSNWPDAVARDSRLALYTSAD